MKNIFLFLSLILLTCTTFAQNRGLKLVMPPTENLTAEKRKAIVIGMSDYGAGNSLDNTLNDADDMAAVLTRLGFEVLLIKNNDLRNLNANLTNWYNSIRSNDMAVFYFAGHGLEVGGQNYLLPVDAVINSETDVQYNTVNVNQVLDNMEEKGVRMKLLILDACRENPFTRGWTRTRGSNAQGLAQMTAPEGTFIAFAASPGATAQDGRTYNLRNGVFTHYLLQEIIKAGVTIDEVFSKVAGGVSSRTNRQQIPFRNSSLTDVFYFIPRKETPPPSNPAPSPSYNNPPPSNPTLSNNNPPPSNPTPSSNNPPPSNPTPPPSYNNSPPSNPTPSSYNPPPSSPTPSRNAAVAEIVRQADEHYDNKRFNEVVPLYMQAAEQGDAWSQFRLGKCYWWGNGVIKDYKQAVEWYKKAAEQGNVTAQTELGLIYYIGINMRKDYKQGIIWLRKAAEQGNAESQYYLGNSYYNGNGVKKNYKQAVEWYRKAAEQGHEQGQGSLGLCYEWGWGVTMDKDQAVYWYKKAADQGEKFAKEQLKEMGIKYP